MRLDAHQHFWRYDPFEYAWIGEKDRVLRRDFLPPDLSPLLQQAGIQGCVAVQARQTVEETRWLLRLAQEYPWIRGVVGWVPLTDPEQAELNLETLAGDPKLCGIRHVVQAESEGFLLRDDFNAGVALLRQTGLAYDILIYERQLAEAIRFVDRHPEQVFVLDHIAKPRIRDGVRQPWATQLTDLARRPNVYCKVSGLVTEANHLGWTEADLLPYLDTVLHAFGPNRLLFGSDWPVCCLAAAYERWHGVVERWAAPLTASEQEALFGGTAARAYKLTTD